MTRRQNLHYMIASQHKLKSDSEYIPKSAQIKLELSVEKGTKEGDSFQALQDKHSQALTDCQQKLKSLVIKAGDIDIVEKKKLTIVSFVESIHDISEGFITYYDRQDITAHQCSVDLIKLYTLQKGDSSRNTRKGMKSKRCLPRASTAPRLKTPCLSL